MIYTITALVDNKGTDFDAFRRTFGYYFSKDSAIKAVKENQSDIHECLYTYVVIEAIPEGIHRNVIEKIWFRWNTQTKKWNKLNKEPKIAKFCNWAMG